MNPDRARMLRSRIARFFSGLKPNFEVWAGHYKGRFKLVGARSYLCNGDAGDREQPTDD
jgi:hypothetical protein